MDVPGCAGGNVRTRSSTKGTMQITVKAMGMYRDRTPEGGVLDLPEDSRLEDVLRALDIPAEHLQVASVNNTIERDLARALAAGDEVTILPTVTGG